MNEPKKPNYSEKEIEQTKLKIEEYDRLKNDSNEINQFVNNHLSNNDIKIKKRKETISFLSDKVPFILCILILIVVDYYLVYNGEFQTTEKKVIAFLYYGFIGGIACLPVLALASAFFTIPFSFIFSKLFNPSFERLQNKEDNLKKDYQINLSLKYNKYFSIQKELDDYQIKLKEYQAYNLRTQKDFWYSLDGHEFEQEIAKIFRKEGFETKVSKVGADGGVDIIVSKNNKRYAVQCKAHTSKISESVARDLYGVLHSRNFDGGYLITLNGTSSKTKEFCKKNKDKPIIIWTIYDIMKNYNKNEIQIK